MTDAEVLSVRDLRVSLKTLSGSAVAVRGVSFEVSRGETVGLVGESGCGKTLTALAASGLLPEGATISGGSVHLLGYDVTNSDSKAWRDLLGKHIAFVFQDPMAALNPVRTIGYQLMEAVLAHRNISRSAAWDKALELARRVKLPRAEALLNAYPHQRSGGMAQRVVIAIAIANDPNVLIADEPTTALDVSMQREILKLLKEIQRQTGMAIVIVSHDLAMIAEWTDRVLVMYAGHIVECQTTIDRLARIRHPYSRALLAARPIRRPRYGPRPKLFEIGGAVPLPGEKFYGCAFAGRCAHEIERCKIDARELRTANQGKIACHLAIEAEAAE
ncbi:ABC transporter ATP-binding protein [Rhizobium sp. BE258]|uniref:ABC transporter ATP-binding protein n=1 Tax=Rhizobium sp. BE258 TaxID=2817722 RepID=UPI002865046B|nr:ABC transporter ATP-binding protein [Rhizobium sp. BE258]MDR7145002.1 peptide/nickel transport system ATP-binding protein [Rhizobium sp. BE258]